MLPTVVMFVNGVAVDRIVGFADLGGQDDFPTINLTRALIKGGVLYANNRKEKGIMKIKKGSNRNNRNDSSDEDNEY